MKSSRAEYLVAGADEELSTIFRKQHNIGKVCERVVPDLAQSAVVSKKIEIIEIGRILLSLFGQA